MVDMREERELYARGGLGPPMVLSYTLQRMLKVHKPFTHSREGLAEVDSGSASKVYVRLISLFESRVRF